LQRQIEAVKKPTESEPADSMSDVRDPAEDILAAVIAPDAVTEPTATDAAVREAAVSDPALDKLATVAAPEAVRESAVSEPVDTAPHVIVPADDKLLAVSAPAELKNPGARRHRVSAEKTGCGHSASGSEGTTTAPAAVTEPMLDRLCSSDSAACA
jgi:hypothetical protein